MSSSYVPPLTHPPPNSECESNTGSLAPVSPLDHPPLPDDDANNSFPDHTHNDEDDEDNDTPFDVTAIPGQLHHPDAHDQSAVHLALYQDEPSRTHAYLSKFKSMKPQNLSLSRLAALTQKGSPSPAISLLQTRHRVVIDDRYRVNPNDPSASLSVSPHYLDYALFMGSHPGFDAALPNVDVDHNWTCKFTFNMAHHLWQDKNRDALPFHPQGRMMYIGTRLDDQLWIAMVPNAFFARNNIETARDRLPVLDAPTTTLNLRHKWMLIMFFAYTFNEMRLADMHYFDNYPDPFTLESVKRSTEIL